MGKRKIMTGGLLSLMVISFVWAVTMQYLVKSNQDIVGEYEVQNYLLMSYLAQKCKQEILAGNQKNLNAILEAAVDQPDLYYAKLLDNQGNVLAQAGEVVLGMKVGEVSKPVINIPEYINNDTNNALAIIEDHMPEYQIGRLVVGTNSSSLIELKSRYQKMNLIFYLGAGVLSMLIVISIFAMLTPLERIEEKTQGAVAYQAENIPAEINAAAVETSTAAKQKPGRKPRKRAEDTPQAQ
jgi:hypothetical protein